MVKLWQGLVAYGLKLDFTYGEDGMNQLVYTDKGLIRCRLIRDVEKYGPMTTKGFKVGNRVSLRAHEDFQNVMDTAINSSTPHRADVSVSYIDTSTVEVEFTQKMVPQFISKIFVEKFDDQQLYLCQTSANLIGREKQLLKVQNEQRQELCGVRNGALTFILKEWENPTPKGG